MNFILILGPPAVGKMTVGQALAKRLDYQLFHNHQSIELALQYFDYGDPGFRTVNEGIRQLIFHTVARQQAAKGFIFTLVMAFDLQEDVAYVEELKQLFSDNSWTCYTVELFASQSVRIARNDSPNRLRHKPSKKEVQRSLDFLKMADERHQLNTLPDDKKSGNYLWVDNTNLSAEEVVDKVVTTFGLLTRGQEG